MSRDCLDALQTALTKKGRDAILYVPLPFSAAVDLSEVEDGNLSRWLADQVDGGTIRLSFDADADRPWAIKYMPNAGHNWAGSHLATMLRDAALGHVSPEFVAAARQTWITTGSEGGWHR
jgi:hypothetical protein